jgi:hypothetical protein
MNAIERYTRDFAKIVYEADTLDCLSNNDRRQISRIFNTFKPEYHDVIADYPLWVVQPESWTPRDKRRVEQHNREGKGCMFLFSHARIAAYLEHAE